MMCMSMKKALYSSSVVSSRTWNRFINCPPPIPPPSTSTSTADDPPDVWHKSTVLPHSQHDCIQPCFPYPLSVPFLHSSTSSSIGRCIIFVSQMLQHHFLIQPCIASLTRCCIVFHSFSLYSAISDSLMFGSSSELYTTFLHGPHNLRRTRVLKIPALSSGMAAEVEAANKQTAALIDGKSIANDIKAGIALEIRKMKDSIGKIPGLGVVLVGKRKDSSSFIRIKKKACDEVGIASLIRQLPEDCSEAEVLEAVSSFNLNPSIHGIIVQLPLPKVELNAEYALLNTPMRGVGWRKGGRNKRVGWLGISYLEKDVDGFHPLNLGCLAMRGREPLFIPCAPKGCIELLLRSGMEIKGKTAVVIGRGKLVGLPTSLLLQRHHATVCMVNAFTKNPEQITCGADIVVSDVGVPNLIRGHWLKPGAFVIDTGANLVKDPNRSSGYRVTGDVCYEEAVRKASAITPVPGGVGPVAISMLLYNTLDSAKLAYSNRCI
ncbi:hypothetical protein LguiB_001475 [Lonicera macranthoides]